jgi:hypothetical protein
MKLYKIGIHETMSGPGINEGGDTGRRVGDEGGCEGYTEGVGIGKSGRVEPDYLGSTG